MHDGSRGVAVTGLFAFLFDAPTRARANEEYQQALAEEQEQRAQEDGKKSESEERNEGKPKCWIN